MKLLKAHPKDHEFGMYYYSTQAYIGCIKFRKTPETFKVYEISPLGNLAKYDMKSIKNLNKHFNYLYVILCKKNVDTLSALKIIAKKMGINESKIGFCGLKDADAYTCQLISIPNTSNIREIFNKNAIIRISNNILLKVLGGSSNKLKIGELIGNYFEILLDMVNKKSCYKNFSNMLEELGREGFLNYYGYQRFGVVRPVTHLVGKALVKRNWDEAIDIYVGKHSSHESEQAQKARKLYREGDLKESLSLFPRNFVYERKIISLKLKGYEGLNLLKKLPKELLQLFVNAYQSYLFNLIVSKLAEVHGEIRSVKKISSLGFVPGLNTSCNDVDEVSSACREVLLEEEIKVKDFSIKELRIYGYGWYRPIISYLKNAKYEVKDNKVLICFELSKGSYASIILREFFKSDPLCFN